MVTHGIFLSACVNHTKWALVRPLGIYQLSWHLREHGYEIQVIDFIHQLDNNEILDLIDKFVTPETKFIGLGFMLDFMNSDGQRIRLKVGNLLTALRQRYRNIKFIMGGGTGFVWSTFYPSGMLFDYYVRGYGENQTLQLFDHYYKGTPHPAFEIVDGNKHLPEQLVVNPTFDFSSSSHKWHVRDCVQPGETLPIEFARGCIFKCNFCRYPHIGKSKNDYTRMVECIREELVYNYENFGVTTYYITDDTMNADKEFIYKFTDMSKSLPFKLRYGAFIRADLIHAHPETVDMYLENGLMSVFFGIESFNIENSKMLGKPWSGKHAKEFLPNLYHDQWKKKINVTVGLIAGMPHEDLDDLKLINKWLIDNDMPTWLWHPLVIQRQNNPYKSDFDLNAEKYGFKFKLVEGKSIWYSDNCDWFKALEWKDELQNEIKHHATPIWTQLLEWSSYGVSPESVMNEKLTKINWRELTSGASLFLNNYLYQLKSLS
jgi:radical SAM superfamily enzyme YgiQ (UPF0313 family)